MKLVSNAGAIALKAHSMWAGYLGLACLVIPEVLFWWTGTDLSPRFLWVAGVVLAAYGLLGRVKDQGIDTVRSDGLTVFLLLALPLIAQWEGTENNAYIDTVANPPLWTICSGHTVDVVDGDYYTDAQCAELLQAEVLEYKHALRPAFTANTVADRLPATREAAYVSIAYNVGVSGMSRSTAVRRLNAGDVSGGCTAITWWNKAGGRVIRGLVRRRAAEYKLCMVGVT